MTLLDLTGLTQPTQTGHRDAPQRDVAAAGQATGFAQAMSEEEGRHSGSDPAGADTRDAPDDAAVATLARGGGPPAQGGKGAPPSVTAPSPAPDPTDLVVLAIGSPRGEASGGEPAAGRLPGRSGGAGDRGDTSSASPERAVRARAPGLAAGRVSADTALAPADETRAPGSRLVDADAQPAGARQLQPGTIPADGVRVGQASDIRAVAPAPSPDGDLPAPELRVSNEPEKIGDGPSLPRKADMAVAATRTGPPAAPGPGSSFTNPAGQTEPRQATAGAATAGAAIAGAAAGQATGPGRPPDQTAAPVVAIARPVAESPSRAVTRAAAGAGDQPLPTAARLPETTGSEMPIAATVAREPGVATPRGGLVLRGAGAMNTGQAPGASEPAPPGQPAGPAQTATTAPASPAAGTAPAERAVIRQITAAVPPGTPPGRIELTLDPPELGRVEISIDVADQSLRASLSAERQATGDLIRRHLELLNAQFREAGFSDVELSYSGQRDGRQDPRGTDEAAEPAPPDIPAPGQARQPATPAGQSGRIDIRL